MEENQKKTLGYVFAGIVLVGLVLVIVGMCIGAVSMSMYGISESLGLFADEWSAPGMPSTTFALIAFIVAIAGAVVLLVDAILRVFVKKDIKVLRLAGAVLAFVGAVLVLVAGLLLAGDLEDLYTLGASLGSSMGATVPAISISAGAGIWLGFIGGLVATVGGALPLLKAFN